MASEQPPPPASDWHKRALLEIVATVLTAVAFPAYRLVIGGTLWFMIFVPLAWLVYLARAIRADRSVLKEWGVRADNLGPALLRCAPFFLVGLLCLAGYRLWQGWFTPGWTFWVVFLLYPLWGLAQQFLVQAMVARNLRKLGLPVWSVVLLAGVGFGMVHVFHPELAVLCVGAGIVWTGLFLKTPNLIPLALAHGWLGTLAYYWILEMEPLQRVILG